MKPLITLSIPLIFVLGIFSCNRHSEEIENTGDEVVYISEEFLTDDNNSSQPTIPEPVENNKKYEPKVLNISAKSAAFYKNYQRQSDAPEEFAKATIWHAISMVYADNFSAPQIKILDTQLIGDRLSLHLQISWRDRWTPKPYVIKGKLDVNKDGSNGKFTITSKNLEAEALELTNPNTASTKALPTI